MADRNVMIHIDDTVLGVGDPLFESTSCAGLPDKARCITGMVYTACYNPQCFNENCTYLGLCADPRHEKKDEKIHAESQA